MEKAFDVKDLVQRLKGRGLDLAEDAGFLLVEETLGWLNDSVVASDNKIDDLLVAVVPIVKKELLKLIDKIDGVEG